MIGCLLHVGVVCRQELRYRLELHRQKWVSRIKERTVRGMSLLGAFFLDLCLL